MHLFSYVLFQLSFSMYIESTSQPLTKIVFGSCNKNTQPQTYWHHIIDQRPDLFVWLGDIVYTDEMVFPSIFREATPQSIISKFRAQKRNKEYVKFRNLGLPIIGIWDDHDFGHNNGGLEVTVKDISKQALLDFLDVPKDGEQYQHEGIYASYEYGPRGKKEIRVIFWERLNGSG
eukprot:TRINITY_DN9739_c0_g1_i2.p2 TRINITY_DN9739_c0_g1~~TRINITY_DN9739_c0_g1_i2.p2  ORF type:complete len:175 (-),score=27.59 TRINITY_DN9739_c0_g1_i2:829-1353(-)